MKSIKFVAATAVFVILLFLLIANFSAVESRFQCPGKISTTDSSRPVTLYLKLEQYRWWVGLWSDSDAAMFIEIPNEYIDNFSNLKKVGDQYQVFGYQDNLMGYFSNLSKVISINLHNGFFDGTCKPAF